MAGEPRVLQRAFPLVQAALSSAANRRNRRGGRIRDPCGRMSTARPAGNPGGPPTLASGRLTHATSPATERLLQINAGSWGPDAVSACARGSGFVYPTFRFRTLVEPSSSGWSHG